MVSTRRTAHLEPAIGMAETDPSNVLRKKPVRRATAKKAEEHPTARGGSAEAAPRNDDVMDPAEDLMRLRLQAKPARRGPGRPKKDVRETEPEQVPARATRARKATLTRLATSTTDQRSEPAAASQQVAKAARRTRATAPKAEPLSPKKITQVPRTQSRNGKATSQNATRTRNGALTEAIGDRAASRRRKTSYENADVSVFEGDQKNDDVVLSDSSPAQGATSKRSPVKTIAPSEASMSSRATTPSHSPAPSFNHMQDANEYTRTSGDDASPTSNPAAEALVDSKDISDDELWGPKTPMKRSSPGVSARYRGSVHGTTQQEAGSRLSQTPTESASRHRRSLATPQTTTQYRRSKQLQSSERAMTVAHGRARTVAFTQHSTCTIAEQASPLLPQIPGGSERDENTIQLPEVQAEIEQEEPGAEEHSDHDWHRGGDTYRNSASDCETALEDPEETNVVRVCDDNQIAPDNEEAAGSFDLDDTVLISRDLGDAHSDAETDTDEFAVSTTASHSPIPETIIWENLRQDITIPLNFDRHLADFPTLRSAQIAEDFASVDSSPMPTFDRKVFRIAEPEKQQGPLAIQFRIPDALKYSADTTIDLEDFIELDSLAESTQAPQVLVKPKFQVEQAAEMAMDASGHGQLTFEPAEEHVLQPPKEEDHSPGHDSALPTTWPSEEPAIPHYAMPTLAFDARRKSLPAITYRTPVKAGPRPNTSDGASAPRVRLTTNWAASTPLRRPKDTQLRSSHDVLVTPQGHDDRTAQKDRGTLVRERTPAGSVTSTPVAATKERYPRLTPRVNYEEHAKTAVQPSRFRTPTQQSARKFATARKAAEHAATPRASTLRPKATPAATRSSASRVAIPEKRAGAIPTSSTPVATPSERYPRLGRGVNPETHAKTVAAAHVHSPLPTPLKRPSTVQKHDSLRQVVLKDTTPMASPMTPAQVPMTPHPSAPLRGVVAMVEVFTLEGASASAPFVALLRRLGAVTTKTWTARVTHVVFKDGSPTTLQRVRLHNKEVEVTSKGMRIHCVNSRWVSDCDAEGLRVSEDDEVYAVDMAEVPRGGHRRRKSMEPSALVNIGGNIVRERQNSLGRSSLGRSSWGLPSAEKRVPEVNVEVTSPIDGSDKENSEDPSSPATPAYLAAPDKLVQQTVPVNRTRKLASNTRDAAKLRRLTFFSGAA
ncbi:hypothetical protein LTR53_009788 [Teratosphaeriaceae sp. CCFEE 6253]|nr:hypothetical protein LTR53_009788 [Teratosphaeriaceae sp. CCFEE 6253]